MSSMTQEDFVFHIPLEKFIFRANDEWLVRTPVGKDGLKQHLNRLGYDPNEVRTRLRDGNFLSVYGAEIFPNQPTIVNSASGLPFLNTWVQPTLKPEAGPFPTIQRVLEWVTNDDKMAMHWLKTWMAAKVQNPLFVPKVAVVIATRPGGGKGLLALCMRQMLGMRNTETVQREALSNRFNSRWADKLFILADEVLATDNIKDVSDTLKVFIDSSEVELEAKHQQQRTIHNRIAWMFASNSTINPVLIETGDRRYTVFINHGELPSSYVFELNGSFLPDRETPTEQFREQLEGFFHHLLEYPVDRAFLSRPFDNAPRAALIEASLPSHELFFQHVEEHGVESLLEYVVLKSFELGNKRKEWDFGEEGGIATQVLYQCYEEFCRQTGHTHRLKINRFGVAMKNRSPGWDQQRHQVPGTDKRVNCYVVPRRPKKAA